MAVARHLGHGQVRVALVNFEHTDNLAFERRMG